MKDKKYRFENIQIYESDEVESHLNKMASKGWKLEKITQLYWKYRKIEPQDLQYAVTYFSEASEFNPHPTENQETFYDYCNAARWTFITQWHQMQIFCTESSSPIAIETDEGIKLKTIHRSMKKNFLPSAFLLLSIAIFQLLVTLFLVWINPIYAFSSNIIIFNSLAWFILLVSYLVQIIGYYHWRKASKKSIDMGGKCIENRGIARKTTVIIAMLSIFAIIIVLLNMAFNALEFPFLVSLLMFALILSIALFVKSSLKRANASRKINLVVTISIIIVASLLIQAIITSNSFKNLDLYNQNSSDSNMVYKMANVNGKTIKVGMYKDAIPLKVEDLQEIKYDYYSYEMKKQVSFLLAHYEASQYVMGNAQNIPNLEYEILDVKWTPLYKLCISEFLKPKNWEVEKWRKINSEPWNADVAYQKSTHNGDINCYLICWENRIVEIRFDETPTENQISIAAKKLSTF